ncbi:MAG TPA: aldo/keto reductase [Abditibacteriaceae bacterium]|jgi:L-glyceraldehyde 3-phosphate reductase
MNDSYSPDRNRYDAMQYRRCGTSGLKLPAISLGCWHNFGAAGTASNQLKDEADFHENCRQMLFTALDGGINHFDLANNYGPPPGAAEERVGRILREDFGGLRDELIISSKAGYGMWPGPYGDGGSRKYLLASLDQSLQRLGLDYVDIFYHHRPDSETPLEESMGALDTAVRSGKALYAGISSYSGQRTRDAIEICEKHGFIKPIIHQPSYSLLNRGIENGLLPATRAEGMGVIAFCPLQQGLLTDKYLSGDVPDDSRAASAAGALSRDSVNAKTVEKVRALNEIAKKRKQNLAQMSLSWVLRDTAVTSALIGASRPEQIKQNLAAAQNTTFNEQEIARIEEVLGDKKS